MQGAPLDALWLAETPEGIGLTLRPAGMVTRSYAYSIDFAIRLAVFIAVATVLGLLGKFGGAIAIVLAFALEWLYPVLFELLPGSATPGKRAMGVFVVMDSGLPITPAASLIRNLLRTADFLPFGYAIGLTMMLVRPDFKRLGDLAAGVLVVRGPATRLDGPLPDATPSQPGRPLTAREQSAVIGWAARSSRLTPERLEELAEIAAPVLTPRAAQRAIAEGFSATLAGVAQWLVGRR